MPNTSIPHIIYVLLTLYHYLISIVRTHLHVHSFNKTLNSLEVQLDPIPFCLIIVIVISPQLLDTYVRVCIVSLLAGDSLH